MTQHHLGLSSDYSLKSDAPGCLGILLWPFVAFGRLVVGIIQLLGRIVALMLGFVLMVVGALLCLTIIGAIVGVPLLLLGLALVVRSLF